MANLWKNPHYAKKTISERLFVMENDISHIAENLKRIEKSTEKQLDELKNDNKENFQKMNEALHAEFQELKEELKKQAEKIEEVTEKISLMKNSLSILTAKSAFIISVLCSIAMVGINFVMDKLKG